MCVVQNELQRDVLYRLSNNSNAWWTERETPELAHSWKYLVMTCIIFIAYRYRYLYLEGIYMYVCCTDWATATCAAQTELQRRVLHRLSFSEVCCTDWATATCAEQTELLRRVIDRVSYNEVCRTDVLYRLSYSEVCCTDWATAKCAAQNELQGSELYRLSYSYSDVCWTDWATTPCAVQTELQWCVLYRLSYSDVCFTDWATWTCALQTELQWSVLFRLSYSDVCCTYWVIATCAVQTELHWCVLNRLCNTQRVLCRLSYTLLSNTGACSLLNILSHDVSNFHYIPVQVFIFGRHIQVCVLYRLSYCDVCCTDWATAICAVQTELQWCVLYSRARMYRRATLMCAEQTVQHTTCAL